MNLDRQRVVMLVFGMEGCGACEHYIPRLLHEVDALQKQGYPLVVYQPGVTIAGNAIPVVIYDAASPEPDVQRIADRFKVEATPTTVVAMRGPGSFKVEGSLANNQIQWVLMMALEANQ